MDDGKELEELIAFVEQTLLPVGGVLETRKRIFMESGVQEVEFDVTITGKFGSANMSLLLECRDRPSQGSAPASWIRELSGKKQQFRLHKVIAVSTTGFSEPAMKAARELDVELRTVQTLNKDAFSSWLLMTELVFGQREAQLNHARLLISESEDQAVQDCVRAVLQRTDPNAPLLKSSKTGEVSAVKHALLGLVEANNLFELAEPNGPDFALGIQAEYVNDDDHFSIPTPLGDVRIRSIEFRATLRVKQNSVPLDKLLEYKDAEGNPISQIAIFEAKPMLGVLSRLEFHRLPDSGTHILMRVLSDGAEESS